MNSYLFLLGRLLYGGYFVVAGFNHFKNLGAMTEYSKYKKIPAPKLAVLVSGLLILLGGLGILLGVYVRIAIVFITIFLVIVTPSMHNFWAIQDPQMRMNERINFGKNVALLGAVLMFLMLSMPWMAHAF